MKVGLYKVVASVEFSVFEPDVFVTKEVRPSPIDTLRQHDVFRVVQSKVLGDGFDRSLIVFNGILCSIKVGEKIPRIAFEIQEERSVMACLS